jgi:hypothetical protein
MENEEKTEVPSGRGVAARALVFASYVGLLGIAASSWARPAAVRLVETGPAIEFEEQVPSCGVGLPPGHPPIETRLLLPPGHPPLQTGPRLPAGHPPIDGSPLQFAAPPLPVVTI